MLVQVITLTFPDGDQTTYVDQVGTEDAAESYFMLDQHLADGDAGTVKVCTLGGGEPMIYAIADVPHADYDNYHTLNKLFHALSPLGWEHSSWKNDTCPSLLKEEKNGNYCQIFVDYADPAMREDPEWPVLSYDCYDAEGDKTFHEEFDNVDKLIIYLTKKVTA